MREIGKKYEDFAAKYLEKKGYKILLQNFYSRYGEIDIIAEINDYIVFVEVKYRKDENTSNIYETITKSKIAKLKKAALDYISKHGENNYRFDAIFILENKIEHFENAF